MSAISSVQSKPLVLIENVSANEETSERATLNKSSIGYFNIMSLLNALKTVTYRLHCKKNGFINGF